KLFNWEGELDFITGKFSKTPLASFSTFGLIQVTIFEVLSGLLSLFGALMILFYNEESYGIMGLILAAVSLSILMLGQRISKDYDGAAVLVPYYILTMFGLFVYAS
ncbi:MAG: DoxX family protein, partial [Candidatus Thermoplasmatota archaeon]|nr:DoxX family protein [Candidatus Thermoplasmatota archaeon]